MNGWIFEENESKTRATDGWENVKKAVNPSTDYDTIQSLKKAMINVLKLHNIRGWHIFVGEVFGHEAQNTQSLSNGSLPQNERSLLFSSSSQDEYEEVLYILPNPSGLGKSFFFDSRRKS